MFKNAAGVMPSYNTIKCIRLTIDRNLTMRFRKTQVFKDLTHYLSVNSSQSFDGF